MEYKELLGERLLSCPSYATSKEQHTLELLKTRFGAASLAHCEVMLQDINDSKRTNTNTLQHVAASVQPSRSPTTQELLDSCDIGISQERKQSVTSQLAPFSLSQMFSRCLSPSQGGTDPSGNQPPGTDSFAERLADAAGSSGAGGRLNVGDRPLRATLLGGLPLPPPLMPSSSSTKTQRARQVRRHDSYMTPDNAENISSDDMLHRSGGEVRDGPVPYPGLDLERVQALVLSQHYWPSALTKAEADFGDFKLPPELEDALADYGDAYSKVQANRRLHWQRTLGLVDITVQLADRSLSVSVSPVHLAVLNKFTDKEAVGAAPERPATLTLEQVASDLGIPESLTRKRIGFWVSKGVLREVRDGVYEVQERGSPVEAGGAGNGFGGTSTGVGGIPDPGGHHFDTDMHSPGQPSNNSSAELEACESCVQGFLNNYSALPLDRIHHFLQLFVRDPPYTQSETQLRAFLTKLCEDGKLEFNGSEYALARKG